MFSSDEVAGPSVATIFVRRTAIPSPATRGLNAARPG